MCGQVEVATGVVVVGSVNPYRDDLEDLTEVKVNTSHTSRAQRLRRGGGIHAVQKGGREKWSQKVEQQQLD